ncbi:hypothetical protein H5410_055640 [Solanum commersonii]|uniref:PH domain-containing protein n=1 Tax=Solanum commersonii TaxID=4109 RepID=A0A9J5WIW4_SOLCO|nr:hypothetical protein H5410_055640 [Solanum commersonii]
MHPFCCVPTINNNCRSSPLPMAPPPAPEFTRSADSLNWSASGSYNHNWSASNSNHHRHRSLTESSSSTPGIFTSLSRPPSMREVIQLTCAASAGDQVKINDIVGNGISGILHKWVNYGKGWRPRWFVLQDGVLSYYKIHGPDRIVVNSETEKGSKVIGEVSLRRISRNKTNATSQARRKPVGEVHLKVSSIRESRSDDRRFSIFTGTKRLHLRAETREDRIAWMEALQAVKDMFPRMSNSELMAPVDDVAVSTDKLRQQLLKEGVSESGIQESELIMRNEFASLQNQLMLLKQKHRMLMDTLRQLETEKVDLENTVVDESQRQCKEVGPSARLRQDKYSEASASESEDDNERVDAAEEDTDDEENTFFDTKDFLSSSSFKSSGSDFRTSSFSSDDDDLYAYASDESVDPIIKSAGTKFPYVKRRKKLPNPIEKEKGVSLWSMIKDNIGKDLTKVCLPVYFNEPLSSLQKSFEDLEYSYLLDRASEWGRRVSRQVPFTFWIDL